MEKVSLLVLPDGKPSEEFYRGIEANRDFVLEVLSPADLNIESGIPFRRVYLNGDARGVKRNALLREAEGELVLFVSTGSVLEEDFLEELLSAYYESPADLVFPNLILSFRGDEKVLNYQDPYGNELSLVASLALEDHLPQWGVLGKRELFIDCGGFNPTLDDYEFYDFLYRNLRVLRLKLADLTYLKQEVQDSFVDTSYRSFVLREVALKAYDWKRELFPFLSWEENEGAAFATAYTIVAERLTAYLDLFNASDYLRRALLKFHNQESLRRLLSVYRLMGLFDQARGLLEEGHLVDPEERERELHLTAQLERVVEELELELEKGKVEEVLRAVIDLSEVYEGAPVYNLLGVINWMAKRPEEAYRFFFKAVTMNPVNQDYLYNLTQTAKELSREKEVVGLVERLVGKRVVADER